MNPGQENDVFDGNLVRPDAEFVEQFPLGGTLDADRSGKLCVPLLRDVEWMGAARVGPHHRERDFVARPALEQQPAPGIEQEDAESTMENPVSLVAVQLRRVPACNVLLVHYDALVVLHERRLFVVHFEREGKKETTVRFASFQVKKSFTVCPTI